MKRFARRRLIRKRIIRTRVRRARTFSRRKRPTGFGYNRVRRRVLISCNSSWVATAGFFSGNTITPHNVIALALGAAPMRTSYELVRMTGFKVIADGIGEIDQVSAVAMHALQLDPMGTPIAWAPDVGATPQIMQRFPGVTVARGTKRISTYHPTWKSCRDRGVAGNGWLRLDNNGTPLDALPAGIGGVRYTYFGENGSSAPPTGALLRDASVRPNLSVIAYLQFKIQRRNLQGETT